MLQGIKQKFGIVVYSFYVIGPLAKVLKMCHNRPYRIGGHAADDKIVGQEQEAKTVLRNTNETVFPALYNSRYVSHIRKPCPPQMPPLKRERLRFLSCV